MKIKNFFHIILLTLIIFFLSKIPRYENTLLQLSENTKIERDYPIFNDDVANLVLKTTNLEQRLYVKELDNINILLERFKNNPKITIVNKPYIIGPTVGTHAGPIYAVCIVPKLL